MSRSTFTPINQRRLTNIAIVRMKRCGKRFEIACYRNKVVNWRNKVELDLDEVLQSEQVYHNVSRGVIAKQADLQRAFGTTDTVEVCKIILDKGDLQVSDGERAVEYANLAKDIATLVATMCVNPRTQRPYTTGTIESVMKETLHFAVAPSRSAKQQALEVIRMLKRREFPIERARMQLRLTVPAEKRDQVETGIRELCAIIGGDCGEEGKGMYVFESVQIDPGVYRSVDELVRGSGGWLQVREFHVAAGETSVLDGGELDVCAPTTTVELPGSSQTPPLPRATAPERGALPQPNSKRKKKKKRRAGRGRSDPHAASPAAAASAEEDSVTGIRLAQRLASGCVLREDADGATPDDEYASSTLRCSTCRCGFGDDRLRQRQHYRSDLHRLNLKLKERNLDPVTEQDLALMDEGERDSIMLDWKA